MKCTKFHHCSAPLCPLREEWLHSSVWTVGEETCTRRFQGGTPRWLRIQRRIARRLVGVKDVGLFTVKMLSRIGSVTSALRGLSPDLADEDWPEREDAWCKRRSPRVQRVLTEEERAAAAKRLGKTLTVARKIETARAQTMSDVERDSQVMSGGRDAMSRRESAF